MPGRSLRDLSRRFADPSGGGGHHHALYVGVHGGQQGDQFGYTSLRCRFQGALGLDQREHGGLKGRIQCDPRVHSGLRLHEFRDSGLHGRLEGRVGGALMFGAQYFGQDEPAVVLVDETQRPTGGGGWQHRGPVRLPSRHTPKFTPPKFPSPKPYRWFTFPTLTGLDLADFEP